MEKKRTIWHAVICAGLVCLIWGGYFLVKHYGTDRILDVREDDFSWVYQVDSVKAEGKEFVLQGFAFELNRDSEEGTFEIVLRDIESGEKYFPKMEYTERNDVNDYFLCEYDYQNSGFEAIIKESKLDLLEKNYEVLLKVRGVQRAYQTGTYISKGELMYANPLEFEPLDVAGTDLEEIVEQGVLRVYRADCGMYVYQYKGELYWIADSSYEFVDGDTNVQYQLDTTQINRLPSNRLENNWKWDNISFEFSKTELLEWNTGKYRVAKERIPTEYSIEKIWTGNYADKWIWQHDFRPYYEFEE